MNYWQLFSVGIGLPQIIGLMIFPQYLNFVSVKCTALLFIIIGYTSLKPILNIWTHLSIHWTKQVLNPFQPGAPELRRTQINFDFRQANVT